VNLDPPGLESPSFEEAEDVKYRFNSQANAGIAAIVRAKVSVDPMPRLRYRPWMTTQPSTLVRRTEGNRTPDQRFPLR
jgi:hypothetical protein